MRKIKLVFNKCPEFSYDCLVSFTKLSEILSRNIFFNIFKYIDLDFSLIVGLDRSLYLRSQSDSTRL